MKNNKPTISFVSPVYKAEHILEKLVIEIEKVMQVIDQPFEVILVDDRSPDNGWEVMKKLAKDYESVKSIRLSRNFGQHPAIMAGLSQTKSEWVVVLDCDLQDQPKEFLKLYDKAMEGYDVVLAKRRQRKDGFF
jgi:dolichol-phosphate mannosyltransferase